MRGPIIVLFVDCKVHSPAALVQLRLPPLLTLRPIGVLRNRHAHRLTVPLHLPARLLLREDLPLPVGLVLDGLEGLLLQVADAAQGLAGGFRERVGAEGGAVFEGGGRLLGGRGRTRVALVVRQRLFLQGQVLLGLEVLLVLGGVERQMLLGDLVWGLRRLQFAHDVL